MTTPLLAQISTAENPVSLLLTVNSLFIQRRFTHVGKKANRVMTILVYKEVIFKKVMIKNLPLLARCFIVSICSPDSFAFFIAEVALGHPDKL